MEYGMAGAALFCALCAVQDCAGKKISVRLLIVGAAAGTAAAGWRIFQGGQEWYSIFPAVLPGGLLLGLSVLAEGKIGRGDGDMVLVLGLFLGWERCSAVLCAALLLTACAAGAGLAAKKLSGNSRLPFAPFLLAALILIWILSKGAMDV